MADHHMIPEVDIPKSMRLPVTIAGDWSPSPKRDWKGSAFSSEPFVGIAILETPSFCEWCLSERSDAANMELRLALFPYDSTGMDVQINFSVGVTDGNRRARTLVPSATYIPTIKFHSPIYTGQVVKFAEVAGNPRITIKVLFIAKQDVESARNGVWHIRRELQSNLSGPLLTMLTFGRKGKVPSEGSIA